MERNNIATRPTALQVIAYAGFLTLLVGIGYGRMADAFFVGDDFNILGIIVPAQNVREATGVAAQWEFFRPLTALTYWANYLVFGKSALAFHVVDFAIHAFNALLVAGLAWSVVPHRLGAALAGALFAWFPMHAESVAWIAGRFDQIYVTGVLICVTSWMRFSRDGSGTALVGAAAGLLIALLGKDTGMIVPAFLIAMMFAYRDAPRPRRFIGLGVLVVLFGGYLALRLWILGGFGGYASPELAAHRIDLWTACRHVGDACLFMVAPGQVRAAPWIAFVVLVYVVLRHGALSTFAHRSWPLFLLFGLALAPAANTVLFGSMGQSGRFLYAPAAFYCAAVGVLFGTKLDRGRDVRIWIAGIALLACNLAGLIPVVSNWRGAGDRAAEIVAQLKVHLDRRPYEFLFIHGLPDHYNGAYVYKNGFENALALFVETDVKFPVSGRVSLADWEKHAAERRRDPSYHAGSLLLRWMPDTRRLIEP